MSNRVNHRRKPKIRNPMAMELEDDRYRQRIAPNKKNKRRDKYHDWQNEDDEDEE